MEVANHAVIKSELVDLNRRESVYASNHFTGMLLVIFPLVHQYLLYLAVECF